MRRHSVTEGTDKIAARIRARRGGTLRPLDEILLRSPHLADGWNSLLGAVRQRTSLPEAIRELVILRVAVLNGAAYEWEAHEPEARRAGLTDAHLAAVKETGIDPAFGEVERRVIAYTDAVTTGVHVADEVFDALRPDFTEVELVELTATVAAYNMVSRFLVALRIGYPQPARVHQ